MTRTRRATAIAACLALGSPTLMGGCSFIFVRGPAKEAPGRYQPAGCTTSKVAPWLDFGVAAFEGYGTFLVLGQTDGQYAGTALSRAERAWILAGTTTLHALSAMYGFSTVATCREVSRQSVIPYEPAPVKQTRAERRSDEAAEEAAVQARLREKAAADAKAESEKAAADAKAAGEAAGRAPARPTTSP
jgi:hypothetical protein